ncbi:hypothetical protein TNCV_3280351, partial [Trichonephila clavipes]
DSRPTEEQICQLSILHKSGNERTQFSATIPIVPGRSRRSRNVSTPKENIAICFFHFRFGARCKPEKCSRIRVHGIMRRYGRLQSAVNIATNSAAEDYEALSQIPRLSSQKRTNDKSGQLPVV